MQDGLIQMSSASLTCAIITDLWKQYIFQIVFFIIGFEETVHLIWISAYFLAQNKVVGQKRFNKAE